jgi:hypothetical protein
MIFDFEYDGICLSSFGMIVCNFGSKGLNTVSNGSKITFNKVPTSCGLKHNLISTTYEDCLETTIQICKYSCSGDISKISSTELRELTKWLNRKKFLKFKLMNEYYVDLFFEASFNINRIEIDGVLYGLELEVQTNRPHALKEPEIFIIRTRYLYAWEKFKIINGDEKGDSTGEYVTSYNRDFYPDDGVRNNYYYVYNDEKKRLDNKYSIHDTSYEEGYIYPFTEITISEDGNLNIYNTLEDRNTYIANCVAGEVITMDYPVIQSSISSHDIQEDFNWNFFRIANTFRENINDLTISIPCSIKIKYSPIVKIGL